MLLSLCLVVGILILLTVTRHFYLWKHRSQTAPQQVTAASGLDTLLSSATKPLSAMEKKYLRLFTEGKTTTEIAKAMNVEPSSVYTMKYRIRKKFPETVVLPF